MNLPEPKSYKVKKGDTLSGIARDHGFRDWKPIWNASDNRALVAKRKAPEKIEPGDVLMIPLNKAQEKEIVDHLANLRGGREADEKLRAALEAELVRDGKRVKSLDRLIAARRAMADQITAELTDNLTGMKRVGSIVDAVATLTQLGISIGKVGKIYEAAASAEGDELEALNKEALKETKGILTEDAKDKTIDAVGKLRENVNAAVAAAGIIAESFSKMTSPSFWAHVWVEMVDNHESWSEAVSSDIGDDIKQRIRTVAADGARDLAQLNKRKAEQQARLDIVKKLLAEVRARIGTAAAEIKQITAAYPERS